MDRDEKRQTDAAEEAAGHGEPGPRESADPTTQADAGLTGGEHPAGPRQEEQAAGESPPAEAGGGPETSEEEPTRERETR